MTSQNLPEVSIALCTYNGEKYIREQLDSILNQDYPCITEIVCLDDRSTDSTFAILEEYASKYPIFKVQKNETNLGYIKNFEKALQLTTKPYIAIADQDDVWFPSKISKLISAIGENLMAYSDNEYIDPDGKSLNKRFSDYRKLTTCTSCLNFTFFNAISGHTMLIDRKLLAFALPFTSEIPYDFWMAFHAAQYGLIPYVDEPLVGYRQHPNNTLGAIGHKDAAVNVKFERIKESQVRVNIFAKHTAPHLKKEQKALELIGKSYFDKSVWIRLRRVITFFQHYDQLLLFKKRTKFRNQLYCIKAFWEYQ